MRLDEKLCLIFRLDCLLIKKDENTRMLFGDANATLQAVLKALNG